ncbi:major facilitator superfamily transporter [Colletotrichum abscissum]|uniref:major facilitator superfamily transporter n=1 Tax=Colletotrichum abscissum TaxID=1671311 RepID=UPI0027D745B3|nr:major facilitator superfamily transporter [Colletotrichum abscissum]KAK1471685.1 major facilitator superfamily transporter [Colletotrichum abscissum]
MMAEVTKSTDIKGLHKNGSLNDEETGGSHSEAPLEVHADEDIVARMNNLDPPVTPEEERRVRRKIDMRLPPFLLILYMFTWLDRGALGNAALMGMKEDLGFTSRDFSLAVSMFFVGTAISDLFTNIGMRYIRPSVYLATAMIIWGIFATLQAVAGGPSGMFAIRFFLGIFEAAFISGAPYLTTVLYPRAVLQTYTIATFTPIIVATFGYDNVKAQLMTAPPYCVAFVMVFVVGWASDRKPYLLRRWVLLAAAVHLTPVVFQPPVTAVGGAVSLYRCQRDEGASSRPWNEDGLAFTASEMAFLQAAAEQTGLQVTDDWLQPGIQRTRVLAMMVLLQVRNIKTLELPIHIKGFLRCLPTGVGFPARYDALTDIRLGKNTLGTFDATGEDDPYSGSSDARRLLESAPRRETVHLDFFAGNYRDWSAMNWSSVRNLHLRQLESDDVHVTDLSTFCWLYVPADHSLQRDGQHDHSEWLNSFGGLDGPLCERVFEDGNLPNLEGLVIPAFECPHSQQCLSALKNELNKGFVQEFSTSSSLETDVAIMICKVSRNAREGLFMLLTSWLPCSVEFDDLRCKVEMQLGHSPSLITSELQVKLVPSAN